MTAIPQMDCCTMLGIDPKTLRHWRESCSSPIRCSSNRCTPQMFDLGASPAVGCPACSPHPATRLSLPRHSGKKPPRLLRHFRTLPPLRKTRRSWLPLFPLSRKKRTSERLFPAWRLFSHRAHLFCPRRQKGCRSLISKRSLPPSDLCCQPSCKHVLASFHVLKWGLLVPMCSSAREKVSCLSPLIRWNGLIGSALFPLSALSVNLAVLQPIERDSGAGEPIALFMVRTTNSLLAPPIV